MCVHLVSEMAVSLADQLKAVKLKKTEGEIKDYSDPKLAGKS